MKFTIHQESRIGGRVNNQDRLLYRYTREALLMVVADGMGGHSHGEVAAQIATVRIAKYFEQHTLPRISDPAQFLVDALLDAHRAVQTLATRQPRPPHTTCVACIIQDGKAWWAHTGDSRLYLIRKGKLLARTRDHSYVESLLEQGLIDADEASTHPRRNLVLSCLGAHETPQIDSADCELQPGDIVLLCSDGVWDPLQEQALIDAFKNGDVADATPQLLDLAERNAGDNGDNLTLIAMCWEDSTNDLATVTTLPDTIIDNNFGTSPALLSDEEIDRAIADIRTRINTNTNIKPE
jgi:PPM family protein phosphatase